MGDQQNPYPFQHLRAQQTGAKSKVEPLKGFSPVSLFEFCAGLSRLVTCLHRFAPVSFRPRIRFAPFYWAPNPVMCIVTAYGLS